MKLRKLRYPREIAKIREERRLVEARIQGLLRIARYLRVQLIRRA